MFTNFARIVAVGFAGIASVTAGFCPSVKNEGEPKGEIKTIDGIQIYHSYPSASYSRYAKPANSSTAILLITDILGIPLLENKLLADSFAHAGYPVIMPDIFEGDPVPAPAPGGPVPDLTEWCTRHTPPQIDAILTRVLSYMKTELDIERVGAVGYCFGGKYVPRFLTEGKGIDVGFIAHPSLLEEAEVEGIEGPISLALAQTDPLFNTTARRNAEDILAGKNATFQSTVYSGVPHGFAVRANLSEAEERFAKGASFKQAVEWFDAWL